MSELTARSANVRASADDGSPRARLPGVRSVAAGGATCAYSRFLSCFARSNAAMWLVFAATSCTGCADRLLLQPIQNSREIPGVARRTIVRDGRAIEVRIARSIAAIPAAAVTAYVLDFGGNAEDAGARAAESASWWGRAAVEVWTMSYPGFGGSDGPAELRRIPDAALAAFDELKRIAGERSIFVSGRSLGSAVALCVASRRPVAGVVVCSPVALRELVLERHGWWNLGLMSTLVAAGVPNTLNSMDNAARSSAPALFMLTGADSIVPIEYQRRVLARYGGAAREIEFARLGHNAPIIGFDEERLRAAIDWLLSRAAAEPQAGLRPRNFATKNTKSTKKSEVLGGDWRMMGMTSLWAAVVCTPA